MTTILIHPTLLYRQNAIGIFERRHGLQVTLPPRVEQAPVARAQQSASQRAAQHWTGGDAA